MHPMLSMALYLKDHRASAEQQRLIFRLPYPGGNWREERENNSHLIDLMDRALSVAVMGIKVKRGDKLSKEEDSLLNTISELLE